MSELERSKGGSSTGSSKSGKGRRPGNKWGVSPFTQEERDEMAREVLAGAKQVDVAKKWNTGPRNIMRYVAAYKKQLQADGRPKARINGDSHEPPKLTVASPPSSPGGGSPSDVHAELEKIRAELKQAYEQIGRMSVELNQLRARLGHRTRRDDE